MNKKVLAFIYDGNSFLALRNNPQDKSHGGDFWFTVTGSIENNESPEEAVEREILEETNLNIKDVFYLNWDSVYTWDGKDHSERNYIALVKNNSIKLDNEHVEYVWLKLDQFVKKIKWDSDKIELKKILELASNRKLFYLEHHITDFRNNE